MKRDVFDSLAPIDYRYWDEEVAKYLSENGLTRYKLLVELALVRVLSRRGICHRTVVREVEVACGQVTTEEVYTEEGRIRHDIRALVNCIRAKVSEGAGPYIHMTATSYDIIDTANAARYKEVGEEFEAAQVGSSTMPQKRNPINFENAKSCWKIVVPRIVTVFMDQISEHQRDLTNSASARTYGEIIAYVVSTAKRLTSTMKKLTVDRANLERNLAIQKGLVVAEPLYIILAAQGHPDAHEKVRTLTLQAQREARPLEEILADDIELQAYIKKMTPRQRQMLINPQFYTGIAAKKAKVVAERWKQRLGL